MCLTQSSALQYSSGLRIFDPVSSDYTIRWNSLRYDRPSKGSLETRNKAPRSAPFSKPVPLARRVKPSVLETDRVDLPLEQADQLLQRWRSSDGRIGSLPNLLHVQTESESIPASVSRPQFLPPLELTASLVNAFFSGSDKLFHVFSEEQIAQYSRICYDGDSPKDEGDVCCLLAVAAVGAHYGHEVIDTLSQPWRTFYDLARGHFKAVQGTRPVDAIKVSAMLCLVTQRKLLDMLLRPEHPTEKGLELYGKTPLDPGRPEWVELRRTKRALVSMLSWLSTWFSDEWGTTLWKRLSGWMIDTQNTELEYNTSTNVEESVQNEMLQVSLLNAQTGQKLRSSEELTAHSLQSSKNKLQTWYDALPLGMGLGAIFTHDELANGTDAPEDAKMGATHCLGVLESCSQLDPVAAQAYTQLFSASRILDILRTKSNLTGFPAAEALRKSISAAMLNMLESPNAPAPDYSRDLIDFLCSVYEV
ncbi:nitrate assimilation regulatory protein nirA [Apiospora aurea]|uniref:Nitrate assimilation regulatory protein nirA n=1 Tax=Apiospora aurea TaxID=335848 RepID=A0ABR1PT18_9PEZI